MKKTVLCILVAFTACGALAQTTKVELYDLVKKLSYDSTGYENVGDWAVGLPKKFPIKWKTDRIEMSDDTSINFYRMGTVDLTIKGRSFMEAAQAVNGTLC